jgi:hypothetical protein
MTRGKTRMTEVEARREIRRHLGEAVALAEDHFGKAESLTVVDDELQSLLQNATPPART